MVFASVLAWTVNGIMNDTSCCIWQRLLVTINQTSVCVCVCVVDGGSKTKSCLFCLLDKQMDKRALAFALTATYVIILARILLVQDKSVLCCCTNRDKA